MKKQILLTGMLTISLLIPVSEAKAQGWPTFDVAKLASLITNLVGRFQPIPQVLSRVNQVKTTMSQIQAVGQAAMSGDLKSIGQAASGALKSGAFTGGKKIDVVKAAEGKAEDAMKAIKEKMFFLQDQSPSMEESREIDKARKEFKKAANSEALSISLYMAINAAEQSEERFKKADEAMKNAETLQDSVNANTMMIMNGNYGRLNQIALKLAELQKTTSTLISSTPSSGFKKPEPIKGLKLRSGEEYSVEEKDEIDVDFE